jgi:hypothetical protein
MPTRTPSKNPERIRSTTEIWGMSGEDTRYQLSKTRRSPEKSHSPGESNRKSRRSVRINSNSKSKCIHGKVRFTNEETKYREYLQNMRASGTLGCEYPYFPKYEEGQYCCSPTPSDIQDELDYLNSILHGWASRISHKKLLSMQKNIREIIERRAEILEMPLRNIHNDLEIPQLEDEEIESIRVNQRKKYNIFGEQKDDILRNSHIPRDFSKYIHVPYVDIVDWYNHGILKGETYRYNPNMYGDIDPFYILEQRIRGEFMYSPESPPQSIQLSRQPRIKGIEDGQTARIGIETHYKSRSRRGGNRRKSVKRQSSK